MDLENLTHAVETIAREGGRFLRDARRSFRPERVETKHEHDYVSYVDRDCERLLVSKLKNLLPEAGFITEEGTTDGQGKDNNALQWVIDPLDGTTNFLRNLAPYCVCIGLRDKTDILLGVVYEVCRDECFSAWKGGSAKLNGNEIHCSSVASPHEAYAVLELPYNVAQYKAFGATMYEQLYGKTVCLRMPGSAAAALCYIAAGRFDLWLEQFIGVWDYTAAAVIVKQAGGMVTDFEGNSDILNTDNIAASNGQLHPFLLDCIAKAGSRQS